MKESSCISVYLQICGSRHSPGAEGQKMIDKQADAQSQYGFRCGIREMVSN